MRTLMNISSNAFKPKMSNYMIRNDLISIAANGVPFRWQKLNIVLKKCKSNGRLKKIYGNGPISEKKGG